MRLILPYPISSNVYWRTRVIGKGKNARAMIYVSPEAIEYKRECKAIADAAGATPVAGSVELEMIFYRPQKSGDVNNFIDVPLDALQGVAYVNDSQVWKITAFRREDKRRPRLEISIAHDPQLFVPTNDESADATAAGTLYRALEQICERGGADAALIAADALRRFDIATQSGDQNFHLAKLAKRKEKAISG